MNHTKLDHNPVEYTNKQSWLFIGCYKINLYFACGADCGGATVIVLRTMSCSGFPDGATPASPPATSALDKPGDAPSGVVRRTCKAWPSSRRRGGVKKGRSEPLLNILITNFDSKNHFAFLLLFHNRHHMINKALYFSLMAHDDNLLHLEFV